MFTGFTPETSRFLWELAFHNERPWFLAHKEEFLRELKEPFDALAQDTQAEMCRRWPEKELRLHVARIYRDARRLHGRGPYKDHLWFSLQHGGGLFRGPMFWFEVGAADYGAGMGFYSASPEQMAAYRAYIDANPGEMERLARGILAQNTFRLEGEDYRRPRGDRGALLNPWYNKKTVGLSYSHDFGEALYSPALPARLAEELSALMPYYELLCRFSAPGPEKRA